MKAMLYLQEASVACAALERPGGHHPLVDIVVGLAAGSLQAFATAGFGER